MCVTGSVNSNVLNVLHHGKHEKLEQGFKPDSVVEPDPFSLLFFPQLELEVLHKRQEPPQH
jgi:hypothetical protein